MTFNYQIAATNNPTCYAASGLPAGLGVDTASGMISGTATTTGTSTMTVSAINVSGTGSSPVTLGVVPQQQSGVPALPAWAITALTFSLLFTGWRYLSRLHRSRG
jgi:hypothetical protein